MFFYVSGIAALTLLINATTAKRLLIFLGLIGDDTAERELVFNKVRSRLTKLMVDILEDMSIDHHFTEMDFERIFAACTIFREADLETIQRNKNKKILHRLKASLVSNPMLRSSLYDDKDDLVSSVRSSSVNSIPSVASSSPASVEEGIDTQERRSTNHLMTGRPSKDMIDSVDYPEG